MTHVVRRPNAPMPIAGTSLVVHQIPQGTDNLVWLVVDEEGEQAAVVDGLEAGSVLAACEALGVRLTTVFNTHTHGDHVGVNHDLVRRGLIEGLRVVGPAGAAADVPGITEPVTEGDHVAFGGAVWRVLLTEGHMNGHVSYVVGDVLFCGDTLFTGGCGYLFDGPPSAMFRSLLRLAELPGDTRVCCAHEYTQDNLRFAWSVEPGNEALARRIRSVWASRAEGRCVVPSLLEEERATNPFLRPGSPRIAAAVDALDPRGLPRAPLDVFTLTRERKNGGAYKALGDGPLPLSEP